MGYFALHNSLWPSCVCHVVSTVVSLLLAILTSTFPSVFLISFSSGFEDILYGTHESRVFGDGSRIFLITLAVLILLSSGAIVLVTICGILNERPRCRAVVFYHEVIFGLLSFIAMCMLADKSRQLEGPIFFHGLLKGWEQATDMNACVRAVDTELETCQTSLEHLDSSSSAQAQVLACTVFWLFNFVSLATSAVWMCVRGVVQIDSLLYCSQSGPKAVL